MWRYTMKGVAQVVSSKGTYRALDLYEVQYKYKYEYAASSMCSYAVVVIIMEWYSSYS